MDYAICIKNSKCVFEYKVCCKNKTYICSTLGDELHAALNSENSDIIGNYISHVINSITLKWPACINDLTYQYSIQQFKQLLIKQIIETINSSNVSITHNEKSISAHGLDKQIKDLLINVSLEYLDSSFKASAVILPLIMKNLLYFFSHASWQLGFIGDNGIVDTSEIHITPYYNGKEITWKSGSNHYKPTIWYGIKSNDYDSLWSIDNTTKLIDPICSLLKYATKESLWNLLFDYDKLALSKTVYKSKKNSQKLQNLLEKAVSDCPIQIKNISSNAELQKNISNYFLSSCIYKAKKNNR